LKLGRVLLKLGRELLKLGRVLLKLDAVLLKLGRELLKLDAVLLKLGLKLENMTPLPGSLFYLSSCIVGCNWFKLRIK
ncbi:MAG: hypothetical protein ACE3JK_15115, partial [Sporolactobacillus sp.]